MKSKIAMLGDEPLNLTKQLDEAYKAEQETEMFSKPGIYFVIREGGDVIRNRSYPCDIHELTEDQVKEMAYEFAHTVMKIKDRKKKADAKLNKEKDVKEENNNS